MKSLGLCCSYLFILLLFALSSPPLGMAAGDGFRYYVNTFGTFGLSVSDSDSLGFIRDYHQKNPVEKGEFAWLADSNFGVQLTANYGNFSGGLQLLAREREESDLEDLVSYAYIDARIGHDFTIRVGKNPVELYLSSDNRAVGYSQLMLRPVPEFYAMLFQESYPGVDLSYVHHFEDGLLTLQGFAGTFDVSFLPRSSSGTDYRYDPMVGFVARYSTLDSVFIASYLWANVTDIAPVFKQLALVLSQLERYGIPNTGRFAEIARADDVPVHYFIAGASTQKKQWTLKGEINHFWFERVGNAHITTAYLLVGYTIGQWTPFGVIAGIDTQKDDIEIPLQSLVGFPRKAVFVAETMNNLYKRVYSRQVSVNLGARWDFHPNMAVKVQWGFYHVDGGGILLWDALSESSYGGGDVNVLSASLDFAF